MTLEAFLTFMAAFGGAMFVMKFILMIIGGDSDTDTDDIHDHSSDGADDTVKSFMLISLQTLYAALMVGGLFGLAALNAQWAYFKVILSTLIGIIVGGGLSAFVTKSLKRLNSVSVKVEPKVGDTGIAYLPMDTGRDGEVMIVTNGRQDVYPAQSKKGLIRAFEQVKVVDKQNNRLIVESLTQ